MRALSTVVTVLCLNYFSKSMGLHSPRLIENVYTCTKFWIVTYRPRHTNIWKILIGNERSHFCWFMYIRDFLIRSHWHFYLQEITGRSNNEFHTKSVSNIIRVGFLGNINKCILYHFSIPRWCMHLNSSSWKTRTCLSDMVNAMAADGLVT